MRLAPVFAAVLLAAVAARADSGVPMVLEQQGRLLDGTDQPVNAQLNLSFRIFDTNNPEQPSALWHEDAKVQVTDGYYAYLLGSGSTPLDPALLAKPELWVSVAIDGVELLPRQRLATVPYALRAGTAANAEKVLANGVDTPALQDGSVTLAKLALTNGKFQGLDADTLDGLDSSAFAPSSIEATVADTNARVQDLQTDVGSVKAIATAGATQSSLDAARAQVDAANATLTQLGQAVGQVGQTATNTLNAVNGVNLTANALKSELDGVNGTVSATRNELDQVNGTVGTSATGISTLQANLTTLMQRSSYSSTCTEANTGWSNRLDCLADGRWHMLANVAPTDYDKNGTTTGAETCKWILDTLVAANLRGRAGVWQVMFSYDQDGTVYTGFYRAQDDSNLTLYTASGTVLMTTDNSAVQSCSLPGNPNAAYVANLSVKL